MTGRFTDRNCNHNDGHSEIDLLLSESADDCRPIAGDFHLWRTLSHPAFLIIDNPNTIYRNAYDRRLLRLTAILKQYHWSFIHCLSCFDFSCKPVNTNGITRFGKVCFELHETDFAAQNPCRMLGWSCSKVAIPIADFTLRFFLFVFHRDLRKGKK